MTLIIRSVPMAGAGIIEVMRHDQRDLGFGWSSCAPGNSPLLAICMSSNSTGFHFLTFFHPQRSGEPLAMVFSKALTNSPDTRNCIASRKLSDFKRPKPASKPRCAFSRSRHTDARTTRAVRLLNPISA
jgi:hypothetical protein